MDNQYSVNELFPTRVLYKDSEGLITDSVLAKSREILAQHPDQPFYGSCISTVNTCNQVLRLSEFGAIEQFISQAVAVFLDIHKINPKGLGFLDSWLNLYDVGGYQDLHNHHDSMISGVFYIKSAGEKDFVLQAPWHFQDRKSTRLNSSHIPLSRMPSSA